METSNNKKKKIIKDLLTEELTPQKRFKLSQLEPVEKEIEKQWKQVVNEEPDLQVKNLIWDGIQRKCYGKNSGKVHIELWHSIAASIAVLLTVGTIWFTLIKDEGETEKYMEVIANQNQMYLLPDSSKVWMEPGSSIQYAKAFNKDRRVWLSGNSLFEVCKHEGRNFQVYINKAFIEVKGTCFLVKQHNDQRNEITLFSGKIEFNVESTGKKIAILPQHKVIYNSDNAQIHIQEIANIHWENGNYNFKDTPLQELIQIINQRYDTNIALAENTNYESAFTGSIRYDESLEDVIIKICFSLNLTKEMDDNKIILKGN